MKKLLTLLLSVVLLCGTALATGTDVDSNLFAPTDGNVSESAPEAPVTDPLAPYPFIRTRTYDGQFSDLTGDSTFYANIVALYEYGLSVGRKDGTYGAKAPATVGQGIIFAGRIRSLYSTGDAEAGAAPFRAEGQHTYEAYLLYLQSLGLIGSELDSLYLTTATRATMAHILISCLPEDFFAPINHDAVTQGYASRQFIQDVDEYTPYFQDILTLYRSGICQGVDSIGTFLPDDPVSRGALAAMLTRLVDPSLRITLLWDVHTPADITWGDLTEAPEAPPVAPYTDEEFDAAIRHMLSQDALSLSLYYGKPVDNAFVSSVLQTSLRIAGRYAENMLNFATCSYYASTGEMTISFSVAGATQEETVSYRSETLASAIAVHDQLREIGLIRDDMTDREKALVYFRWICENCVYDNNAEDTSLSHTAWSLFTRGIAVCDGYTGAYNLLLKLEGIPCYALAGSGHAWTVATLDGTEYHIDTTWGDSSIVFANELYFAMSPALSFGFHPWE